MNETIDPLELDLKSPSVKRKAEEDKDSKIIEKLKLEIVDSNLEGGNGNAKFVK